MLTTITNVRYLNKNNNANERENYAKWWKEQIEHYGTVVDYYTHGYSLTSHNFLYGEDPTSKYLKTEGVVMLTDITNDALMLSKFGIMADCDMTAVIHISSYYEKFGCGTEPKAGDLIQLTEYAADRPGGRSAPIYEITERDDEYLQMTNSLMSHYVWYIKCKRFEYSYEPGITPGINERQISDGGDYGHFGEEEPGEMFQPYPDSVQNSAKSIYDYYSEDESDLNARANHYVAPDPASCPVENFPVTSLSAVPGPYSSLADTIPYDQDLQDLVFNAAKAAKIVAENRDNIVLDVTTPADDPNLNKFSTQGKPEDTMEYTAPDGTVSLSQITGGRNA
jgi:hypothetical protein